MVECPCCGGTEFTLTPVLWPELIEAWELSVDEVAYIDRQQGLVCAVCGANLRSMALAAALLDTLGLKGTLRDAAHSVGQLRVLEINEAGSLTQFLRAWPGHSLVRYPDVDMQAMPFADGSFDIVVHSDTLEHVPDPVRGLSEVRRVLATPGFTCFTTPIVVGRMSRSRHGLPPSFHLGTDGDDVLVHTEYGADYWTQVARSGFDQCRTFVLEYPAGLAVVACRGVVVPISEAQVRQADAAAAAARAELSARAREVAELRRELGAITGSRGWRAVLAVRRAADTLRPRRR